MAYRVPTAVNRAYAKFPIEQPRASVHVLVPTLTLRRLALELTGATSFGSTARLGSSLHPGFEAFLCLYLLRALSSAETSIEGKKIPGEGCPPLLVVSSLLPVVDAGGGGRVLLHAT
jgi:hypothetical protein